MMFVRRSIRLVMVPIVGGALAALPACEDARENLHPVCEVRPPTILMAEAVQTASRIPCVRSLRLGWEWGTFHAEAGEAMFVLGSAAGGDEAVTVRLVPDCRVDLIGGEERQGDPRGVSLDERVLSQDPYEAERTYAFDGGCALVRIAFATGAPVDPLLRDVEHSLGFLDRQTIDDELVTRGDRRLDPVGL
jgi:hypothetical protein